MSRLGFICDDCEDEFPSRDPAAAVQDEDNNWLDLCSSCYDDWDEAEHTSSEVPMDVPDFADHKLPPAEQWAEDLYQTLTTDYGLDARTTSVIGMGHDNTVYVTSDAFSQLEVRNALRSEGYQPRQDPDAFAFQITPDFTPDEGAEA